MAFKNHIKFSYDFNIVKLKNVQTKFHNFFYYVALKRGEKKAISFNQGTILKYCSDPHG